MRNFRDYEVWKNAIGFTKEIYLLTATLPPNEKFGIISQIQRASVSISSNIAEGCSRYSEKDFARFVEIALGSAYEVESIMVVCLELNLITKPQYEKFIKSIQIIQKQLSTLYIKLTRKN
jgi:four helix bundle protein